MVLDRRTLLVSTTGAAAVLSFASPLATAAAVANADINDDTGQTEQEVAAELWQQASADPAVVSAYKKLMAAIATGDAERARIDRAGAALKAAKRTANKSDDDRAARDLSRARKNLVAANALADNEKGTWDLTIETRLVELEALHSAAGGGAAPAPAAGPVDGTYTGKVSHKNPFGDVQVTITLAGGKITACSASYPTALTSGTINNAAVPTMCSEAVATQSAAIGAVGGASYTTPAFKDSLADAIRKAGL